MWFPPPPGRSMRQDLTPLSAGSAATMRQMTWQRPSRLGLGLGLSCLGHLIGRMHIDARDRHGGFTHAFNCLMPYNALCR